MTYEKAHAGSVLSLFRYPVKSMMGEELTATEVTQGGVLGDRFYALVDAEDGKIASAKNPRKWPNLFQLKAAFTEPPRLDAALPPVQITLPDGSFVTSTQQDAAAMLSCALNRTVTLHTTQLRKEHIAEGYWPDLESFKYYRNTVTDYTLPEGTFFDGAVLHVLTTATLDTLRERYPQGGFEPRRFRPNIVIKTAAGNTGFAENEWIGKTLLIGKTVRLQITRACPRCVMTTLPQGNLPKDLGILKTAVTYNNANAGVYAAVLQGGTIRSNDPVQLT